jgi:hypothetical protein
MGITISYRGSLAELGRIEDFEDRLIDFALQIGGRARIWRTWADDDPDRMVRGVILDLELGQESTSLLAKNAIRFCNRQWTCSCESMSSFAARTRALLSRSARSLAQPVKRWAGWAGFIPS